MPASKQFLQALAVTVELTGTDLSPAAAKVMADDLAQYPEAQVLPALMRCRRELKGRLTIADVLARLDDGRPGPEEAWAMLPKDEHASAFWTDEIREAAAVCHSLIREGETVQARMAFLEKYRTLVQRSRDERIPVKWTFTPGLDRNGREAAILEAAQRGRISAQSAAALLLGRYRTGELPYHADSNISGRLAELVNGSVRRLEKAKA